MGLLSFLGLGNPGLKSALRRGATIIDVRTPQGYDMGHIPDAFNIPVDRIKGSAERLKASGRPVIVCCQSGSRSADAMKILKSNGVKEVYNGGNWESLLKLMEKI